MDDNLDSQSKDQKSNNHSNADNKRIDSIPLWLQGISENAASSREPDEGEWQKEQAFVANQETGPTPIEITEIEPSEKTDIESEVLDEKEPEIKEIPLPNWIEESDETFDEDQTVNITLQQAEDADDDLDEITEEVIIEAPSEPAMAEPLESEIVESVPTVEDSIPAPWKKPVEIIPQDEIEPETAESVPPTDEFNVAPWERPFESIQLNEIETEIEEPTQDEAISENEEIPDWLREMIAADEKQQQKSDEIRRSFHTDEPTQPVNVASSHLEKPQMPPQSHDEKPIIETFETKQEGFQPEETNRPAVMPTASFGRLLEEHAPDDSTTDEPEEPKLPSLDEFDLKLERDFSADFEGSGFQPIQFDPPVMEDQAGNDGEAESENGLPKQEEVVAKDEIVLEDWRIPSQDEKNEPEPHAEPMDEVETVVPQVESQEFVGDIPSSLITAKENLELGEVKEALDIIKSYISQSQYLNEIKEWLLHANSKIEKNKSGLWEALGDISSHQGDYSSALDAYAKAIKFLELSRNNRNEIS